MIKQNFSKIVLSAVMGLTFCLPGLSAPLTKSDIEQSEVYSRKKAEIRYTKIGNQTIREVYIDGFRVNEQNLASLVHDKQLSTKIGSAVSSRRSTWGATIGLGIPTGAALIYLAANSRASLPINNSIAPIGQTNQAQSVDFKTFALGTLGAIVTLYAVSNSVSLLNDISGLNSPAVLNDREASDAVKKYNDNLKTDLLNQTSSNNLNNNDLSSSNNNIMILNVNKSF